MESSGDLLTTMFNVDDFSNLSVKGIMRLVNLFLSEAIATGLMMLIICSQCHTIIWNGPHVTDTLTNGLVGAFAVSAAILSFIHISGAHLNPAISLAAVILSKMSLPLALLYIVAQCLGSLFGYTLSRAIMPLDLKLRNADDAAYTSLCCSVPNPKLHLWQVLLTEFLATSIVTFAFCSCVDKRNEDKLESLPVKFALLVAALSIAAGAYSSASLNPARSLGPALVNNYWKNHWCFWIGPILGSVLTASMYRIVFDPAYMEKEPMVPNPPLPGTAQNQLMLGINDTDDDA